MVFRKRMVAFIIDVIFFAVIMIAAALIATSVSGITIFEKAIAIIGAIIMQISMLGVFLKDVFFGMSIGKKITGIRVISCDGGNISILQAIFRNITFLIWPIEILLLLDGRERLGDRLSKTKVVLTC